MLLKPLKVIWYKDWTKLWGYVKIASGAVLLSLSEINSFINDPTFKTYLDELDVPKSISIVLVVLGLITWLASKHKED